LQALQKNFPGIGPLPIKWTFVVATALAHVPIPLRNAMRYELVQDPADPERSTVTPLSLKYY